MPSTKSLKMKAEYQMCRTWGHAWEDFVPGIGQRAPAPYGRGFSLRCVRCTCERHDCFDVRGGLNSRRYDYPSGYQLAADEVPDIQTLRLSVIREMRQQNAELVAARAQKKPRSAARTPKQQRRHMQLVG